MLSHHIISKSLKRCFYYKPFAPLTQYRKFFKSRKRSTGKGLRDFIFLFFTPSPARMRL